MKTPPAQSPVKDSPDRPLEAVDSLSASGASENQIRILANAACNRAVFISDERDHIVFWSAGLERLLGFPQAEAYGRTFESLAAETSFRTADLALLPSSSACNPSLSTWLRHKNGTRLWCSLLSESAKTQRGETLFVNFVTDCTEQKQSEDTLRAANENKDRLLANVSHELRTPLSAILLWSQLFEEKADNDSAELKEGLDVIRRSAIEQRELIEDLVDSVRIDQGKLRLDPEPTDLAAETLSGLDVARILAREKRIQLSESIGSDLGTVRVDPHRWNQIIRNLVSNALKFTPAGGRVEIRVTRIGTRVEIQVSDTGIGISPDFLPSIFKRFGQADSSTKRAHSGLGLGLGITRELVKLHGGEIRAESRGVGHGAKFTVSLPLPLVVAPPAARFFSEKGIKGQLNSRNVLLVEDCAETRNALAAVLSEAGANVIATGNAGAALHEFHSNPPDIIISDLGLPHMDGNEFIAKVRAMEKMLRRPATPALVLTAYAGQAECHRALQNGFSKHLAKPAEPMELIEVIQSLMPEFSHDSRSSWE